MHNTLITIWLENHKPKIDFQYGSFNKGLNRCWKQLWKILNDDSKTCIYEFDLTKFFDRVNIKSILPAAMIYKKIPLSIRNWIFKACVMASGNMSSKELERELKEVSDTFSKDHKFTSPSEEVNLAAKQMVDYYNFQAMMRGKWSEKTAGNESMESSFKENLMKDIKTLPQGFSLSPQLTNIILDYVWNGLEIIYNKKELEKPLLMMYVDDGLLIGDSNQVNQETIRNFDIAMHEIGTEINMEKSRFIKREGK